MGRVAKKYYGYCPLMEDFHIRNMLGGRERRQLIFGLNVRITDPSHTKVLTLSGLTGGMITEVDHLVVVAQYLGEAAPENRTRITNKIATGFTLVGDFMAYYSLVVMATLPAHPRGTPKWAKDYCPGCKNLDFWAILGSIYKDVAMFHMRVKNGVGGSLAVNFRTSTAFTGDLSEQMASLSAARATDLNTPGVKGSSPSIPVSQMANLDYQVILFPSSTAPAIPPWVGLSTMSKGGFTLNGDASEYLNILILGQIQN